MASRKAIVNGRLVVSSRPKANMSWLTVNVKDVHAQRAIQQKRKDELLHWKRTAPRAMVPRFFGGRWRRPEMSARDIARIRKVRLLRGEEWLYDKPEQERLPVFLKGHRRHERSEQRRLQIEEKMKQMPAMVQKYYEAARARRKRQRDFLWVLNNP